MAFWSHRLMPERSFFRKLFVLASGTLVGQLLVVASSPLLTRLFTPEAFGLFAVFSAVTAIVAVASCLRLEFAIPVAASDAAAAAVVVGAVIVATVNSLLVALLLLATGHWLVSLVAAEPIAPLLWLVPLAGWAWGIGSLLTHWSLRRRAYRVNGVNRMLTLGTQAGSQVGFGLAGLGSAGLVLGYILGYVVRVAHHALQLSRSDRRLIATAWQPATVWRAVRLNWRYPAFVAPSSLLHTICEMVPAVLIATLYGPAVAGWYALSQRIMSIPVKLLGEAASEVFLGEGSTLARVDLHRFFVRTTLLFFLLGMVGITPLLLFAPQIFSVIFGAEWYNSGVFVQLLTPLFFARFVSHPISQIFNMINRQGLQFITAAMNFVAIIISFILSYYWQLSANLFVFIYSLSAAASFALAVVISWRLVRKPDE